MRRLAVVLAAAIAAAPAAAAPKLHVVATNLNSPRKLFLAPGGALYVVEAGTGGRVKCVGTGANEACAGSSGSITRIEGGRQTRVVTGLFSMAKPTRTSAQGPADVVVRRSTFTILMQDGVIDAQGRNAFGAVGETGGKLIQTPAGRAAPKAIANLAAYEAAHNPDHGAGPGAAFGNPPIDSDPYAFVPYRGGYAVADAAANDLLWVKPNGAVSVLAVFPTRTQRLTLAVARAIGAPATMHSIAVQSVPSCVAVGPDGALYVGELTGAPFTPGSARVWRVVPGRRPTLYAAGFTTISDLAFLGRDLLVLELSGKGLLDRGSPGALVRVTPQGKQTVLARAGLHYPTGLAVGAHAIYVSNDGVYPGTGPGPHGEVVSLPR
jgi:hypothetical protein